MDIIEAFSSEPVRKGKEAYRYWSPLLEGESHVMSLHSEGVKTIFFCAIKIKNVRRYITTMHASYEPLKMCISPLFFSYITFPLKQQNKLA